MLSYSAYCSIHVATSPDPSAGTDSARVAAARIADKDSTIIAGRGGLHYFHCEPVTVSASAMDEGQVRVHIGYIGYIGYDDTC